MVPSIDYTKVFDGTELVGTLPTEVGIESPGQALTLFSEDGLRFVCRTLSEGVLASRTFGADLRTVYTP